MTGLHKEVYGHGEPIVMLHGWAMHTGVWRDFARVLAQKNQLICLDLPGHGCSESIDPFTLETVVEAVYAELPEQACVLVGWSLGGNIALRLAEKYPRRIKSIVLIASNPHFLKTDGWAGMDLKVLNEFATNLQKKCVPTLLRFMSLQVQGKADAKASLRQVKFAMQECEPPAPEVLAAGLKVLQTADQRKALSRLKQPVLMILGECDTLVPVLVGKQCKALQAQIELHVIVGAGHIPFVTDRTQLCALVLGFMRQSNEST